MLEDLNRILNDLKNGYGAPTISIIYFLEHWTTLEEDPEMIDWLHSKISEERKFLEK